jgi:hypothetical protein
MKSANLKQVKTGLFTSALAVISIMSLIDIQTAVASIPATSNFYTKPVSQCKESVPESPTVVGIIVLGILGCGYLLKRRIQKHKSPLNNSKFLEENEDLLISNSQVRIIPFIELDEFMEEDDCDIDSPLELVEPK